MRWALNRDMLNPATVAQAAVFVGVTVALLRLNSVAQGDDQLAATILATTGYVTPLVNVALSLVPQCVLLFSAYALQYSRIAKRAGRDTWLARNAWLIAIWSGMFLAYVMPIDIFLISVAFVALVLTPEFIKDRRLKKSGASFGTQEFKTAVRGEFLVVVLPVLFFTFFTAVTNTHPWMTEENIATPQGVVRGYVLSVDPLWTTILVDNPRYLVYVKSEDVDSRSACSPPYSAPVIQTLPGLPNPFVQPPECPDVPPANPDGTIPPAPSTTSTSPP